MSKRRTIGLIALPFFILIYLISLFGKTTEAIYNKRCSMGIGFWPDAVRYGDLYGFSYLPEFRSEVGKDRNTIHPEQVSTIHADIDLYAIGDSYLTDFIKTNGYFCRTDKFMLLHWLNDDPVKVHLDHKKINVLLIEKTEREVQNILSIQYANVLNKILTDSDTFSPPPSEKRSGLTNALDDIFSQKCNKKLEFLLFDYPFALKFKELKARINEKMFGRTDKDVVISTDRSHLLFNPTVNVDSLETSSFAPLQPGKIDAMIQNLNNLYLTYKNRGFDYIYFSIIPNPSTILESKYKTYNNLIPLLLNDKNRKIPMIDTYTLFCRTNKDIYAKSDTHWNSIGFYLWLDQFNGQLKNLPPKTSQ